MFEIIICLSLCKHRRGLCHQGKDEIVKESEKGMLNDELTDIEWQIEAEFVAYFIISNLSPSNNPGPLNPPKGDLGKIFIVI